MTMSNNNNNNNNNNEEPQVKECMFTKSDPLDSDIKGEILGMIAFAFRNFIEDDETCRKDIPDNLPDFEIKRTVALASAIANSVVEHLERKGAVIVLDKQLAMGIVTPYVIVGPGLVFGVEKHL